MVFLWPSLPQGVLLHTWAVTACGGMSIGDRAALDSAAILAATSWDLMRDASLRAAVREDWRTRIRGRTYVNAIPPEQVAPIAIPEHLRKTGGDELDAATG